MEERKCPICGEQTNSYMGNYRKDGLCRKHAQEFKDGKITKCEKCNNWHNSNTSCTCEQDIEELPTEGYDKCLICGEKTKGYAFCKNCYRNSSYEDLLNIVHKHQEKQKNVTIGNNEEQENKIIIINEPNKSKCITCGKQTDGLLFCGTCYHKYKDKELLFKITNCSNVELLDDSYEGKFNCKDGHIVKSKTEREIDNYLFEHDIPHAYEKPIPYGSGEKEILHPDFYLPNYLGKDKHVYIEHWGYNDNNIKYTKSKKFKIEKYKDLHITLICTHEKTDTKDIDTALERKLNKDFIKENEINFDISNSNKNEELW